jgi:hypothetical protein
MYIVAFNSEASNYLPFLCQLFCKQECMEFTSVTTNHYGFICEFMVGMGACMLVIIPSGGVKGQPAHGADNLTAICEPIV